MRFTWLDGNLRSSSTSRLCDCVTTPVETAGESDVCNLQPFVIAGDAVLRMHTD